MRRAHADLDGDHDDELLLVSGGQVTIAGLRSSVVRRAPLEVPPPFAGFAAKGAIARWNDALAARWAGRTSPEDARFLSFVEPGAASDVDAHFVAGRFDQVVLSGEVGHEERSSILTDSAGASIPLTEIVELSRFFADRPSRFPAQGPRIAVSRAESGAPLRVTEQFLEPPCAIGDHATRFMIDFKLDAMPYGARMSAGLFERVDSKAPPRARHFELESGLAPRRPVGSRHEILWQSDPEATVVWRSSAVPEFQLDLWYRLVICSAPRMDLRYVELRPRDRETDAEPVFAVAQFGPPFREPDVVWFGVRGTSSVQGANPTTLLLGQMCLEVEAAPR